MMLSFASTGYVAMNMAGRIAKYLAISLAIEKVVSAPRVISNCLPTSTRDTGLESHHAQRTHAVRNHQRRSARTRNAVRNIHQLRGHQAALLVYEPHHGFRRALTDHAAIQVDAAHARLRPKRDEVRL